MTQREIGELLDWGKSSASNYSLLLSRMSTHFLDLCKAYQVGRVDSDSTRVDGFSFTEGWFRTSGLYDLNEEFQLLFFDRQMTAVAGHDCRAQRNSTPHAKLPKNATKKHYYIADSFCPHFPALWGATRFG